MIPLLVLFVGDIKPCLPIELKLGEPVPDAGILDQILTNNHIINSSNANDGSVFDFLFGDGNSVANKYNSDNLDVSVLDYQNVHKIVEIARRNLEESRRQYPPYWLVDRESYWKSPFLVSKSMDLMKQSIYATRYRLDATLPFRKRFHGDISYNIAIMYGSLTQILLKMDNMYAQMAHLPMRSHLVWYLIFYEKILAAHVDATSMVKRMFAYQTIFENDEKGDQFEEIREKQNLESTHP